jgi:hypothetical protein
LFTINTKKNNKNNAGLYCKIKSGLTLQIKRRKAMGYPKGFLESRAVVKPGLYKVIPPEGRVINSLNNVSYPWKTCGHGLYSAI